MTSRATSFGLYLAVASAWSALAQDPITAFPKSYKAVLDNQFVSVIRVHYGPHERLGVHDHSKFPTVYVYLNDSGPVRFTHDEQPPFALVRPPTVKGAFRVSPGRLERHAVENLGDADSDFLRVELKQLAVGSPLSPFRGKAPSKLSEDSRAVEFASSKVQIQRIICPKTTTCNIDRSAAPSLLIAFSPLDMRWSSRKSAQSMREGDLAWVERSDSVSIVPVSAAPAHLLRIILLS